MFFCLFSMSDIEVNDVNVPFDHINIRNHYYVENAPYPVRKFVIKDVVEISQKHGGLPIYACDKESKTVGAKVFYTGSYDQFWSMYGKLPSKERCFYETILPEQPCHLYIDMEGDIVLNDKGEDVNDLLESSVELLNELIDFLIIFIKGESSNGASNVAIKKEDIKVIELDSSSEKKFSKHYIIKLFTSNDTPIMFFNNFHCGAFMRRFQKYIVQMYGGVEDNKFFHNHTSQITNNSTKNFMIDMGVYTLRRQFRIIGSAKRTQAKHRREIWVHNQPRRLTKEMFLDCLVQYIPSVSEKEESVKIRLLKVHELNGCDPISSSLKSFDSSGNPMSIAANSSNVRHQIGNDQPSALSLWSPKYANDMDKSETNKDKKRKKIKDETMIPITLQNALKKYYKEKYGYVICGYIVGKNRIKLETYDKRCMHKKSKVGDGDGEHKFNHVYFILFTNTLHHIQGCYDDTYCIDLESGKKCNTKLGKIDELEVIREIREWQKEHIYQNWYDCRDDWTATILEEEEEEVEENKIKII